MSKLVTARAEITKNSSLNDLIARWLYEIDLASDSVATYAKGLQKFMTWRNDATDEITPLTIRQWRDALKDDYAPASVNAYLSAVRSFFSWAVENDYIQFNPAANIKGATRRGTSTAHKRDELTNDEIRRVLAIVDGETAIDKRNKAMIAMMAYCALRQVEVHRADIGDLQTKDNRLVLWVQGKGRADKDELVVLPGPAVTAIQDWMAQHPTARDAAASLFCGIGNRSAGKRLSRVSIRRITKAAYGAAGVIGSKKTTHSLRHSAITNAIRHGANPIQVQAMARHASINTTMIYHHETTRIDNPAEDSIDYD